MWLARKSGLWLLIHDQYGLPSFIGGLGLFNSVCTDLSDLYGRVLSPGQTDADLPKRVFSSDRDLRVPVV